MKHKLFKMIDPNSNEFDISDQPVYLKGRGAQINPASRFDNYIYDPNPLVDEDPGIDSVENTIYQRFIRKRL